MKPFSSHEQGKGKREGPREAETRTAGGNATTGAPREGGAPAEAVGPGESLPGRRVPLENGTTHPLPPGGLTAEGVSPGRDLPRGELSLPSSPSPKSNGGRRSEALEGSGRGRVVGSRPYLPGEKAESGNLHLASTLKASALERGGGDILPLNREDLRRAIRKDRTGNLILFLVDASASMRAMDRIECAKKAVLELLADAYRKRDRVGLVTFRDRQAQLVLAPTSSVQLARLCVRDIATGGSTPLCHGLELACRVIKRERRRDPSLNPIMVILTDGFGNVPIHSEDPQKDLEAMAREIREEGISCAVFDTLEFPPPGLARSFRSPSRRLADILDAAYYRLNSFSPGEITGPLQPLLVGKKA